MGTKSAVTRGQHVRSVIEREGERQDGLLGPVQMATVGRGAIRHRCSTGRWTRVRRGVVRITGAPPTWHQALRAALLASGDSAYLSHATAARFYGLDGFADSEQDEMIELSAPLCRKIRLDGVWAHRLGTIEERDVRERAGIRYSSPVRLVLDLSGRLGVEELGKVVDELMRRRLLSLVDLHWRVARTNPAPGRSVKKLHAVLSTRINGYDPGESVLEARIGRLLRDHRFPKPTPQYRVEARGHRFRLDFAYPEVKLFLESDGFGYHRMASDLDRDHRRQNLLVLEGWRPLRVTARMSDEEIVATLDAVYDRDLDTWRDLLFGRSGGAAVPERPNG